MLRQRQMRNFTEGVLHQEGGFFQILSFFLDGNYSRGDWHEKGRVHVLHLHKISDLSPASAVFIKL